jgi:hypothetical protein
MFSVFSQHFLSGSSTNLELAIQLAKLNVPIKNRVRFCWWGAEEHGLLGKKLGNAKFSFFQDLLIMYNNSRMIPKLCLKLHST